MIQTLMLRKAYVLVVVYISVRLFFLVVAVALLVDATDAAEVADTISAFRLD